MDSAVTDTAAIKSIATSCRTIAAILSDFW
jgi:hypothetical protein